MEICMNISLVLYGKPNYQASETVIGESEWVIGIKDDAWGDGAGLEDLKHLP